MKVSLTPADLICFEDDVAERFRNREICSPVHLSGGNESQLIEVFEKYVEPDDWCCFTWRSHYGCLLKGVPRDEVMAEIVRGRSISLCFPEYRILSSAIVGGTAPIAVGLAAGIKAKGQQRKVVCFLGDMAAESGVVHEAAKYAYGHRLPILFVVEDNGISVTTNTEDVWGRLNGRGILDAVYPGNVIRYAYTMTRPHCGIGKWVAF